MAETMCTRTYVSHMLLTRNDGRRRTAFLQLQQGCINHHADARIPPNLPPCSARAWASARVRQVHEGVGLP